MNKHQIARNYVEAMRQQRAAEEQVSQAFSALGSDNSIFALSEPIEGAYTELVCELLGPDLFDWLMWWMYETDCGTYNMEFVVNGTSYDPTQINLHEFLQLVDPPEPMGS